MSAPPTIHAYSWPVAQLGEALEHFVRRARFDPSPGEPIAVPDVVQRGDDAEVARWMTWVGERLGVEAEAVEPPATSLDAVLLKGGPVVLQVPDPHGVRFALIVGSRLGKPRLLCPDLRVRSCALDLLREALTAPHEAPLHGGINRLLRMAQVPVRHHHRVRTMIARERLGESRIARGWLLRLPPSTGFMRQLRDARVPGRLATMLGLFAFTYAIEIAAWRIMGSAALDGRFDTGWLTGWVLLVFSMIPLGLAGSWIDASVAIDVSRLIKTRLLMGALRFDLELVRQQGVGQLLGRVMESQAFESLALSFGLASLVSLVELAFAASVLSAGAAGPTHLALLLAWLSVAVALASRFHRRLGAWSQLRLEMTHALVERMVGHRTVLAQELPARRDLEDDAALDDYLHASAGLDRAVVPFLAGLPSGWMFLALLGLVPAFVSGAATPSGLAISVGGILLANRAFSGTASGLASAAGAFVAWRQMGPLFTAGATRSPATPFVSLDAMRPKLAHGAPTALIDADALTFRYQPHGELVLRGASVTIHHGDRLLLEGPSGGGKSTLASLLVGLRAPETGMLLLNGLDRFTLGEAWHQFATAAPQFHENHILSGTLGFNLLMGRQWPAEDNDLAEATALCEELGLGDLLRRMPSGMMQTVGETGWQLSHGEKSRIFLARALLQDAQLTVLDESFAALDPESLETCLTTVVRRARTLAVIAHP